MRYSCDQNKIEIIDTEDFDPDKIFECGQCFRWNSDLSGVYRGVFQGMAAKVYKANGRIFIEAGEMTPLPKVIEYFDLERDYEIIRKSVAVDEYMQKAVQFGKGIRLLRQEPWETLCSFIISQCNNIPRIKKIIETMCSNFGEPLNFDGSVFYTFPSAEKISKLSPCELDPLRCGYRASYIIDAAKAVAEGSLNLESLASKSYIDSLNSLKQLNGVGDKVANCIILFGLHMLNSFPIDVWIKRVIKDHYDSGFSPDIFGEYAGVAQQYMFFYSRSGEK